jgi:RNA-directed DNA polymerase
MEKMGSAEHEESGWRSFESLVKAYRSCRFGKSASLHQIGFETKLGKELLGLHEEIIDGKYRPKPAVCFYISRPKPREIFASHFRDRIVHHLIISRIEPLWERRFSYSSFACRKGKGTHGALRYLQKLVRSLSQGGEKKVWALHVDLKSFFVTIDRNILVELLTQDIADPGFRNLVKSLYLTDLRVGAKKYIHLIMSLFLKERVGLISPQKRGFQLEISQVNLAQMFT